MIDTKRLKKDLKVLFTDSKIRSINIEETSCFVEAYIVYGNKGCVIQMVEIIMHKGSNYVYKVNGSIVLHMIDKINHLLHNYKVLDNMEVN